MWLAWGLAEQRWHHPHPVSSAHSGPGLIKFHSIALRKSYSHSLQTVKGLRLVWKLQISAAIKVSYGAKMFKTKCDVFYLIRFVWNTVRVHFKLKALTSFKQGLPILACSVDSLYKTPQFFFFPFQTLWELNNWFVCACSSSWVHGSSKVCVSEYSTLIICGKVN